MVDETNVQVRFTVHDDETGADFTDALYYPISSWPVSDAQLAADKQERFDNWKAALTAPPPDPDPADPAAADPVTAAREILSNALAQLDTATGDFVPVGD